MAKDDPIVPELVDYDIYLEERKVLLLSRERNTRLEIEAEIRAYISALKNKIATLTGERNIKKLKNLIKKWRETLGDEVPISAKDKYLLVPSTRLSKSPSQKNTLAIQRWISELRKLLQYSTSQYKLHPDYIPPTKSANPEISAIIEAMHSNG